MPPLRSRPLALLVAAALSLGPCLAAAQDHGDVSRLEARPSPAWVHDAVVYELNPRTFSAAGTFDGVTARLDSLRALGVNVIWLMPINPIGQLKKKGSIGSPYAVRDYTGINPAYGTAADLHRLITEAHRRGLRVILDVVFNHTSWDNTMMAHPAYYRRDAQGHIVSPYDWTDVAALDYTNPDTRRHMLGVLTYWLRDFDVDGFRCDVAGEVPTDFWEEARTELTRIKPDILMLAEAHKPALLVKAFDLDYSWPLYGTLVDVLTAGRSATAIRDEWQAERASYPRGALHLRFVENHDEQPALVRFGERGAMAASALMFTLDGVPLLYNGMEAGDATESGAPALFERLPVFWQSAERRPETARFYRAIIALRHREPALDDGSLEWLHNSDEDGVLTFLRRDAHEELLVAINLTNRPFVGTVEGGNGFVEITPGADSTQAAALPALALGAWGWRIFRRAR